MESKPPASRAAVAERAHSIWENAGRPDGQDLDHWLRAETELAAEATAPRQVTRKKRQPAPKKAAAKAVPASKQPRKVDAASPTARKPRTRRARPRPEA